MTSTCSKDHSEESVVSVSEVVLGVADKWLIRRLADTLKKRLRHVPCQICEESSDEDKMIVLVRSYGEPIFNDSDGSCTIPMKLEPRVVCRFLYREHRKDGDLDDFSQLPPLILENVP